MIIISNLPHIFLFEIQHNSVCYNNLVLADFQFVGKEFHW